MIRQLSFDEAEDLGLDGTLRTGDSGGEPWVEIRLQGDRIFVGFFLPGVVQTTEQGV